MTCFSATPCPGKKVLIKNKCAKTSFSSSCARCFFRSLFLKQQELAAPADLVPCSLTSFSATPCSGRKVLTVLSTKHDVPQRRMTNPQGDKPGAVAILHGDDRGDIDHSELCSVKVSRCIKKWSQLSFHIFHLTRCDSQASFFATVIWNEINLNNKCVQESFSSMCARYFVRSLFFLSQELRAPADLGPCTLTCFSARPCSGKKVLIKNKCAKTSFSSSCARCFFRSLFLKQQELAAPADLVPCSLTSFSATPCSGRKVLTVLSTKHDVPQRRMTNPQGDKPGAVAILHGDDRGDIDHSELCSVKVSRSLPTVCRRLQRTLLGELAVCVSAA